MTERSVLPYCGSPPLPSTLWFRWNADPILLAVLVAAAWLYWLGSRRAARTPAVGTQSLFYAGWTIAAASLISPLCALSVSLFAARLAQHAILALVAAPLVAAGRPLEAYAAALRAGREARGARATVLRGAPVRGDDLALARTGPLRRDIRQQLDLLVHAPERVRERVLALVGAGRPSGGGRVGPGACRVHLFGADGAAWCADHPGAARALRAARADHDRLGADARCRTSNSAAASCGFPAASSSLSSRCCGLRRLLGVGPVRGRIGRP